MTKEKGLADPNKCQQLQVKYSRENSTQFIHQKQEEPHHDQQRRTLVDAVAEAKAAKTLKLRHAKPNPNAQPRGCKYVK
jgi:hypothetical protein